MAAGLRFFEAIQIEWSMVTDDGDCMTIYAPEWITKTRTARTVGILDSEIADHLCQRGARPGGKCAVGRPHNPNVQWDRSNAREKARYLYNSELVKIAPLLGESGIGGDVWRATLNEVYLGSVSEVDRVGQFDRTAAVNRRSYTTQPVADHGLSRQERSLVSQPLSHSL